MLAAVLLDYSCSPDSHCLLVHPLFLLHWLGKDDEILVGRRTKARPNSSHDARALRPERRAKEVVEGRVSNPVRVVHEPLERSRNRVLPVILNDKEIVLLLACVRPARRCREAPPARRHLLLQQPARSLYHATSATPTIVEPTHCSRNHRPSTAVLSVKGGTTRLSLRVPYTAEASLES